MHLPHPVHAAFVTVAHGRLEAPMDRIGLLRRYGLWPKRCVAGTARRDFAGWHPQEVWLPPAALSQDRCVARCGPGGPCGRPVVACLRSAGPRWPGGKSRLRPVGVALAGGSPRCRASRGCRRAGGRRRPRYASASHAPCRAFPRAGAAYGCPGSGVGAPCLWSS